MKNGVVSVEDTSIGGGGGGGGEGSEGGIVPVAVSGEYGRFSVVLNTDYEGLWVISSSTSGIDRKY